MAFRNEGEDVDDALGEYDQTPYQGVYDICLTYGHPIPASEETSYPISDFSSDCLSSSYSFASNPSAYEVQTDDDVRPKAEGSQSGGRKEGSGSRKSSYGEEEEGSGRSCWPSYSHGHVVQEKPSYYGGRDREKEEEEEEEEEHSRKRIFKKKVKKIAKEKFYNRLIHPQRSIKDGSTGHESSTPSLEDIQTPRSIQDGLRVLEQLTPNEDIQVTMRQGYEPPTTNKDIQSKEVVQEGSRGLDPPNINEDNELQELTQDGFSNKENLEMMQQNYVKPSNNEEAKYSIERSSFLVYSYSEIMIATNNLDESSKVGKGGYGHVYKAKLRGTMVAIKVLDSNSNQGQKEFFQELDVLCQMRHQNLVNLIGACFGTRALVYEYVPNGSLEDCLNNCPELLTWQIRANIIYDICSALKFLHSNSIVHGDIKPDNILLDDNFEAKLTDFGLCRFLPKGTTTLAFHETNPKGTLAYIDLKFLETGILRPSSDLYSFGVTILKIVTGLPPLGLSRRVYDSDENLFAKMMDPHAGSWPFEVAKELAYWGLQCCYHNENSSQLLDDIWFCLRQMLDEIQENII